MTDNQRRYMRARDRMMLLHVTPATELLDATRALVDEHKAKAAEAEKIETKISVLLNMNEDGNFTVRVALMQIWEALGVKDQTAAMQKLRDLQEGVKICLDAERARLADLKPGAPASQYTAGRIEKLERLIP